MAELGGVRTGVASVIDVFFFSSRRRHTRFDCDWSSDVCSSDLEIYDLLKDSERAADLRERARRLYQQFNEVFWWEAEGTYYLGLDKEKRPMETEIGRASCRERV